MNHPLKASEALRFSPGGGCLQAAPRHRRPATARRSRLPRRSTTSVPWAPEIETTIREHHKLTRHKPHRDWLVEPFRKTDLIDVSRGLVTFGLPRGLIKDMFAQWPSAGFHKRLVQLSLNRLVSHPLSPLPMVRV